MLRPFRRLTVAALLATVTACAATDPVAVASIPPVQFDPMTSVVKLANDNGHGSGVHIGDGLVITAAHVLLNEGLSALYSDGSKSTMTVLWTNSDYDIAAVKVGKPPKRGGAA